MKKLIKSHAIYTERGCLDGGFEVRNGKISRIFTADNLPDDYDGEITDYGDCRIIPGIIEMHIHGFKGWSAFSSDKNEIQGLSKSLPSVGITAFLPTNHYRFNVMENAAAIAEVMEEKICGARILGTHMEGPFINPKTVGSMDVNDIHKPDLRLLKQMYEATKGHIVTMTLAPEMDGNMEIIDWLTANSINPCIGQSIAAYDQCEEAIDRGAVITQKTGNCMGQIHQREVGTVGAAMLDKRIYNEINSDLAHCSKQFMEILYRMKGYHKLCMVADNNRMSGMTPGIYEIPEESGRYTVGLDGLLHQHDGTIDGSALSIIDGIRNWVEVLKIPMEEAVVMASLNAAKVCRIDQFKGSIKEGKDADYAVIDDQYRVLRTIVEGEQAYDYEQHVSYENKVYSDCLIEKF